MHRITLLFELVETLHLLLCLVPCQQLSEVQHSECFCFVAARVKICLNLVGCIVLFFNFAFSNVSSKEHIYI